MALAAQVERLEDRTLLSGMSPVEFVPGFGTGFGDNNEVTVSEDLAAPAVPASIGPFAEDDGSITLANPTGLVSGSAVQIDGTIGDGPFGGSSGDFDFFEIAGVSAGDQILVDVDTANPTGDLDPLVAIFDSTGTMLAFNDNEPSGASLDSLLRFRASTDGDLFVAIGGASGLPGDPPAGKLPSDPNDSSSGPGAGSTGTYSVTLGLNSEDVDVFSFDLEAGDIFGANVLGSATNLALIDPDGDELIRSSQDVTALHPTSSPLPGGGNAALSYVIPEAGTYSIAVTGGTGAFDLALSAFRPVLEQQEEGAVQTIFLDFDGATIDTSIFGGTGTTTLSGLDTFLPNFGLTLPDRNAVIDSVVATFEENFSTDIRARGNNGDFDVTGNPGDFDVEILNSRDHADPFGEENVSRVIIGGTAAELGIPNAGLGLAESVDVGNFETEETAVVLLDQLSSTDPNEPNSLNNIPLDPTATITDLVGTGVGNIAANRAGRFSAAFDTDPFNTTGVLMDRLVNLPGTLGLGPDGVFGSSDDVDVDFGTDVFAPADGISDVQFTGVQDTVNAIAFGLSTGTIEAPPLQLIEILPNTGGVLVDGDVRNRAPNELLFRFNAGQVLDPATLDDGIQFARAGFDDEFIVDSVPITPGFIGLGDEPNEVIVRFAETLPDDLFQITIVGSGVDALLNDEGEAFNEGNDQVITFELDLGAQVVAVNPQPVARDNAGNLVQNLNQIVVHFNEDDLDPGSAQNPAFYQLINTQETLDHTDDVIVTPDTVAYDADANTATLTFNSGAFAAGIPAGTYRLRIGTADEPSQATPIVITPADDDNSSFGTATVFGGLGATEVVIRSQIQPQPVALPPLPGALDEPSQREINVEGEGPFLDPDRPEATGTDPVLPDGIEVIKFNFPDVIGFDPQGNRVFNAITEQQKERAREIFEIYADLVGVEFVETDVNDPTNEPDTISVATGDLRVLNPSVPTGPGGVAGLNGDNSTVGSLVVMDPADFNTPGADPFGGAWFQTAMHEIGHALGLGHLTDLIAIMSGNGLDLSKVEGVFPTENDLVPLRRLFRADSNDIDLFQFNLDEAGVVTAEIFAERLDDPSLLNSVLTLFDGDGNVLARNDDAFSNDSFIELSLDAGTYFIAVTSTGNTDFNPAVSDTGSGGKTDGNYELRLNFLRTPGDGEFLVDATGTRLDGDADGGPGGVFDFWFQATDPAGDNTIFVDKATGGDAGASGSLADPFANIDDALAAAEVDDSVEIVRIVGNGGTDGDLNTPEDALPFLIGFDDDGNSLPDGTTFEVPEKVTVMIDAGAVLKLQDAIIGVGSPSDLVDQSNAALQILGTPDNQVVVTSFGDDTVGGDTDGLGDGANPGDFGGVVFRGDSDLEEAGVFLNIVNQTDIRYGGGEVVVTSDPELFNPVHVIDARPTISFNTITNSADSAVSANPNSFDEEIRTGFVFDLPGDASTIADGDTMTFVDDAGVRVTFEFDPAGDGVTPGNVNVNIAPGDSRDDVLAALFAQVNGLFGFNANLTQREDSGRVDVAGVIDVTTTSAGITILDRFSRDATLRRVGPDIHGNTLLANSVNGLFIRTESLFGVPTERVDVAARFDDTDIVHVVTENVEITGNPGGPLEFGGVLSARESGRLRIDPAIVVKLGGARIEATRGASNLIAEGTESESVIMTSIFDDRFGRGGTFDTTDDTDTTTPQPGDFGGIILDHVSNGSIDHAFIAFGGGIVPIEGELASFNVIEAHQADLRLTNSRLEDNAAGQETPVGQSSDSPVSRNGRGVNDDATVFVRGSQPIIVGNVFLNNGGSVISINANSLTSEIIRDPGRSTGFVSLLADPATGEPLFTDNAGPLVRRNVFEGNAINGMVVRGETLTTESIWDDTDIVHVVLDDDGVPDDDPDTDGVVNDSQIIIPNFRSFGGLRLQSAPDSSLVVKLEGDNAGFNAAGKPLDIDDRIGGVLQVMGDPLRPVVITSLLDNTVGAGFDSEGLPQTDTDGRGGTATAAPGDFRGLRLEEFSHDRNVEVINETESSVLVTQGDSGTTVSLDENATPDTAQFLGELARDEQDGDENRRLGFEVHGFIASNDSDDADVFSFDAFTETEVFIDIDRTDPALNAVVELLDPRGNVLAASVNNETLSGMAFPLQKQDQLGGDFFTSNPNDPAFRVLLPGNPDTLNRYFIRVRSLDETGDDSGDTFGQYQLQIRLRQTDEKPGSTVRGSDIRFATNAIELFGQPAHSPLVGTTEDREISGGSSNDGQGSAQDVGNILEADRAVIDISGLLDNANDVDFFQFDVTFQDIQNISGFTNPNRFVPVVFDLDLADGLARANTNLSVFDSSGRLVFTSTDANVAEDRPAPEEGNDTDDLSRGSVGGLDSFIGPVTLPEGTFFAAVSTSGQVPQVLDQFFLENPTDPLVRLEPINSVQRIAEDHIEDPGIPDDELTFSTAEPPVVPRLVNTIDPFADQESSLVPFNLGDVVLFVSSDPPGTNNTRISTVDPFTGVQETTVGTAGAAGPLRDIELRGLDLVGFTIRPDTTAVSDANTGNFIEVDTGNAAVNVVGDDGIQTFVADANNNAVRANANGPNGPGVGIDFQAIVSTAGVIAGPGPIGGGFFAVGNRGDARPSGMFDTIEDPPGPGLGGPDFRQNILFQFDSSGVAQSRFRQNRGGQNQPPEFEGAGTQIVERGFLDTRVGTGGFITGMAVNDGILYAVDNQGGLYIVNAPTASNNGNDPGNPGATLTFVADIAAKNGLTGPINFQGLAQAPQQVEDGLFDDILIAIDGDGTLYAIEVDDGMTPVDDGNLQPIFVDAATTVETGIDDANGLRFSNLERNLFQFGGGVPGLPSPGPFDGNFSGNQGRGINPAVDTSRPLNGIAGGNTLTFGNGNFNFAGGAHGTVQSGLFSLEGFSAQDQPVLFFNYFLETEDADGRDALRVFLSGDDGVVHLLATNTRNVQPPFLPDGTFINPNDEFDDPDDGTDTPGGVDGIDVDVQQLFDDTGTWRQARVDLSDFAGQNNLKLRFEFSTAADRNVGDPDTTGDELRALPGFMLRDGQQFVIDGQTFEFEQGITVVAPGGSEIGDGETLTIDGTVFEFDSGGGIAGTSDFAIPFSAGDTADEVAQTIRDVVAANMPSVNAIKPDQQNLTDDLFTADFVEHQEVPETTNRINLVGATNVTTTAPLDVEGAVGVNDPNAVPIVIDASFERFDLGDRDTVFVDSNVPNVRDAIRAAVANTFATLDVSTGAVTESEPNDTNPTAQDIDAAALWSLAPNPDITDGAGVNTSTSIPHVSINGTGDGTLDIFKFTANAGDRAIFDIDNANGFDAFLTLKDSTGSVLATNDDFFPVDPGSSSAQDPLLEHTFTSSDTASGNTFFIEVSTNPGGVGVPAGASYTLHVSVEDHPLGDPDTPSGAGNIDTVKVFKETVRIIGHTVDDPGPLGLTRRPVPLDRDTMDNAQDGLINGLQGDQFGNFGSNLRGQNNGGRGVFIDDIIIGFAERGEMVTRAPTNNANFAANQQVSPDDILQGEFQLQLRRTEEFATQREFNPNAQNEPGLELLTTIDTNDRLAKDVSLVAPAGINITDGQTFTLGNTFEDNANNPNLSLNNPVLTFEFVNTDVRPTATPGNVAISFTVDDSAADVAATIRNVINSPQIHEALGLRAVLSDGAVAGQTSTSNRVHLFGNPTADGDITVQIFDSFGDQNNDRSNEQGQLRISGNQISNVSGVGILVAAGARDAGSAIPHPGSVKALPTLNDERLVPGPLIENNVISNFGTAGISFSGDPNTGNVPVGAVPFGRIVNNTIFGGETPAGTGIQVSDNASPTLLNNIVTNTTTGIDVDGSSSSTVVDATVFQGNGTNEQGVAGSNTIDLGMADLLFVDPANGNFVLAAGSRAIDSSLNRLADRPSIAGVKSSVGIGRSAIFAPEVDVFGLRRVDDPDQSPPPGLGFQIFKDRGAIERSDFVGPEASLIVPQDNGVADDDSDVTEVFTTRSTREFVVQLRDSGIGVDDDSVTSDQFLLGRNGEVLREGVDFVFIFDPNRDTATFRATRSAFAPGTYTITINNSRNGGVRDRAGNPVRPNQPVPAPNEPPVQSDLAPGTTGFTVVLASPPALSIDDVVIDPEGDTGDVTTVDFTVSMDRAPEAPVSVEVFASDETAESGTDFAFVGPSTLTFTPIGPLTQTVSVDVLGDVEVEPDETFFVNLANVTGPGIIAKSRGRGTIVDDEPSFSIDDVEVFEGDAGTTSATFTVSLSRPATAEARVSVETADGTATVADNDFIPLGPTTPAGPTVLTFAPGETSQQVSVQVVGDTRDEFDETFFVNLTNLTPTVASIDDGQGMGTILNTDPNNPDNTDNPALSIDDVQVNEGNIGTTPAVFTVSLSAPTNEEVTVDVETADGTATVADNDFVPIGPPPQTLTFRPGGPLTQTVAVNVVGDTVQEETETFTVNLSNPTAATISDAEGTGTILDDDRPAIVINDVAVREGDIGEVNFAVFTVSLSKPNNQEIRVDFSTSDGTALVGEDFDATSGTLIFSVGGSLSQQILVPIIADSRAEGDEMFFVDLSNPVNGQIADPQGKATIIDEFDDPVPLRSAEPARPDGDTARLEEDALDGLLDDALAKWAARTSNQALLDEMNNVNVQITNLQGDALAMSSATSIFIDPTAAGFGWFVDTSPQDNAEFQLNTSTGEFEAQSGPASGQMDLLTVLVHEFGHIIGLDDLDPSQFPHQLMTERLDVGIRRLPGDVEPSFRIEEDVITVNEGDSGSTQVQFTVSLSSPSTVETRVTVETNDGSATLADGDFANLGPRVLKFAAGEQSKTVNVTVNGDTVKETNESFFVKLSNPFLATIDNSGSGSLDHSRGVVTIVDDDDASVSLEAETVSATEGTPFSATGVVSGGTNPAATVDFGDGSGVQPVSINADGTFDLSHTYADDGTFTVTVNVTDDDGTTGSDTFTVSVNNVAPVVEAGPDATLDEGDTFTGGGSFSDVGLNDTHTATVDFGDGTGEQSLTLNADGTFDLSHTYADDGTFTVTVNVTDDDGTTGSDTFTVSVNNVVNTAPTVDAGPDDSLQEGAAFHRRVTLTDPDVGDSHTATVDFGDGNVQQLTPNGDGTFDLNHIYADDGTFTVTVEVTDEDGATDSDTFTVTVTNAAPVVEAGPSRVINEGGLLTLGAASFHDAGALDTHTVTIDWGDGRVETGTFTPSSRGPGGLTGGVNGRISGSHRYRDDGVFIVSVTVSDGDTSRSDRFRVTVRNVAPTLASLNHNASSLGQVAAGEQVSLSTTFSDRGVLDTYTAVVDWGDGTTQTFSGSSNGSGSINTAHTFTEGGIFNITVTLDDGDGGVVRRETTAFVTGVGVNNGALQIVGTNDRDLALVSRRGDSFSVLTLFSSFESRSIDASGVNRVHVALGGGNDTAIVSGSTDSIIDGGAGNDTLLGGSGNDILIGGEGRDLLLGRSGNDILINFSGRGLLLGGSGNDMIVGGTGDDLIVGNSDDRVDGGGGKNTITGGRRVSAENEAAALLRTSRSNTRGLFSDDLWADPFALDDLLAVL